MWGKVGIVDVFTELLKRSGAYASTWDEIRELENISAFEYVSTRDAISKEALREVGRSSPIKLGWRRASSSGTSGQPFLFPQPLLALQREQAFIDRIWSIADFSPKTARTAVLRGVVVPGGVKRIGCRLLLSCDGWSIHDVKEKISRLQDFNPSYIHCYPSLLERLLRHAISIGFPLPKGVVAVFSGSEACTADQEALFYECLGARTISWYGQSEQVALAVKESDSTHAVLPGYSDVAFIRHDEKLEIVGKSQCNPFFSKTWYRTGDYCDSAEIGWSKLLGCNTILMRGLEGRSAKKVYLSNGEDMPFNHFVFGLHSHSWSAVDRYCFVQIRPGLVRFAYSLLSEATPSQAEILVQEMKRRLPDGLELEALSVPELSYAFQPKWKYFFDSESEFESLLKIDVD